MEYRELKNSLCLIDNVGFSRSSNKDFTFSCFIQKCNFYTTILLELMGHLESDHKNEKWFGFCYACNSQIYHRKVNLLKELEHMTQEGYHKIGKAEIAFICLESESKQKKMKEAVNAVRANRLSCDFDNGKSIVSLKPWTRHTMKTQMHCKKMLSKRCLYALYKCMDTNCSFSTMYAKKMLAHLEGHERRPSHGTPSWLECAYCDTISDSSSTLLEHIRNEHGSSLYQCKYCFYRSSFAYYVVVHLDQFHEFSIKKVLVCNGKEKRLENEKESIQENRAKNVYPIRCSQECRKVSYLLDSFINHLRTSTNHDGHSFKCQFCGLNILIFEAFQHLLNHRIGVYQCLHCIYGANNIRTIRRHMCNTHPTKSPYVCVRLERKYQIFNDEELESVESTMILQLDNSIDQKLFERCPLSDGQLDNLCDANIANNSSNPLPDPLQETGDFLESTSSDAPVENDKTACNLVQSIRQDCIPHGCDLSICDERMTRYFCFVCLYSCAEEDKHHIQEVHKQNYCGAVALDLYRVENEIFLMCPIGIGQEEINKFCLLLTKGSREFEQTNCFNNQYLNGNDSLYLQTESDILMTENIPIQKENCENSYTIHNNDDAGQGDITIKQKSIPPPVKLTRESYNLQMKTTPVKRKVEPLKENQSKQVKKVNEVPECVAINNNPIELSHIISYKCFFCLKTSSERSDIHKHWEEKHKPHGKFLFELVKIFQCFYCRHYNSYEKLKDHCRKKHMNDTFALTDVGRPNNCGLCFHVFNSCREEIIDHFRVHHNKDTITISLENYLSDPLLDRICTEDNEISPPQHDEIQWVCPECGKTSHNQLDLVAHIRQHFLQFQCSFCEEKLDSFLLIKKHNEIVHKKDNQIYRNVDINENLEQYLNMKMIFPNGLMLTKKQSKNTRFGGMKDVIKMIENLNNEDLEAVRQEENQEGFIHAVLQPNML